MFRSGASEHAVDPQGSSGCWREVSGEAGMERRTISGSGIALGDYGSMKSPVADDQVGFVDEDELVSTERHRQVWTSITTQFENVLPLK